MPKNIAPSQPESRKRKRSTTADDESTARVHSTEVNMDKLMAKLSRAEARAHKSHKKKNNNRKGREDDGAEEEEAQASTNAPSSPKPTKRKANRPFQSLTATTSSKPLKKNRDGGNQEKHPLLRSEGGEPRQNGTKTKQLHESVRSDHDQETPNGSQLTSLQSKMKGKLEGARFRYGLYLI